MTIKERLTPETLMKCNRAYSHDIFNGDNFPWCSNQDCCGCSDCGNHEYTFTIDEHTKLILEWNNWRNYRNHIEIQCYNPDKEYWETIFYCSNHHDVTSYKNFWLSENDRKFLMNRVLSAIMELKQRKIEQNHAQSKLI